MPVRVPLLVNVSNDAWFGGSIAPQQHLQIARMRAVETGRPMLRATNTGVTAIVDARGQAIDQGLALYFPAPHSYTGEDVVELHLPGAAPLLARSVPALEPVAEPGPAPGASPRRTMGTVTLMARSIATR